MVKTLHAIIVIWVLFHLTACSLYNKAYSPQGKLDFKGLDLAKLPTIVSNPSSIVTVDLSQNPSLNWSEVIKEVCNLPNLQNLILAENELTKIPTTILNCKQLKGISLANNPNLDFTHAYNLLRELPITFLNLSNNRLTSIPLEIGELSKLKDLRLSHNQLSEHSALTSLSRNTDLFSLWLDNNKLKWIPSSLTTLSQIEYLYLDHNQLSDLPNDFIHMNVKALWIGHNDLTEIPDNLARSSVIMAFLNNNKIRSLGNAVEKGEFNLQGVVLNYNQLSPKQLLHSKQIFDHAFIYQDENQRK